MSCLLLSPAAWLVLLAPGRLAPSPYCLALCPWTSSFPSLCLLLGGLRTAGGRRYKKSLRSLHPTACAEGGRREEYVEVGVGASDRRPLRILLIFCQEVKDLGGELGVPGRSSANNRKQPGQGKGTPSGTWGTEENLGSLLVGWETGFTIQSGSSPECQPLLGTMAREPALGEPKEA